MGKLLCIRGRDQKEYRVIQEVSSVWENLAHLLNLPQSVVAQINRDNVKVEDKCRDVFVKWLDGAYRRPVTWNTLLTVIEDIEHAEFEKQFRKNCFT